MNGLLFISHQTERYTYLQSIEIALKGGCRLIQLRMKDVPEEEVELTARKALDLCNAYNAKLFIDDHVEVCRRTGAAGVHLGKLDMRPSEARHILGNGFLIGGTANTFEDILYIYKEGADYIGLGPLRFTSTKKNLSPVLGFEGYRAIVSCCREAGLRLPIWAIGGITADDIAEILQTGVKGIALSSAILNATNPIEETKKIIHQIELYSK